LFGRIPTSEASEEKIVANGRRFPRNYNIPRFIARARRAMTLAWQILRQSPLTAHQLRCMNSSKHTWHGHPAFRIEAGEAKILIDPFLSDNPPRDNGWSCYLAGENSTQRGDR
jgi:hypothetical protein